MNVLEWGFALPRDLLGRERCVTWSGLVLLGVVVFECDGWKGGKARAVMLSGVVNDHRVCAIVSQVLLLGALGHRASTITAEMLLVDFGALLSGHSAFTLLLGSPVLVLMLPSRRFASF